MKGVKTTLTAKLKLLPTPDQFRALRATQLAYRDGLNYVSSYSFAHRKTSSVKRLQQATYADLRRQFGLPSQMAFFPYMVRREIHQLQLIKLRGYRRAGFPLLLQRMLLVRQGILLTCVRRAYASHSAFNGCTISSSSRCRMPSG